MSSVPTEIWSKYVVCRDDNPSSFESLTKKPPSKELASLYPQSNLDWHIVTCDSIRLHSNQHKVVPSRSAFMFNVCIVFILYILYNEDWEKKEHLYILLWFCCQAKHRQSKTDFLASFSPYILLSGGLLYFKSLFVRYLDKSGVRV